MTRLFPDFPTAEHALVPDTKALETKIQEDLKAAQRAYAEFQLSIASFQMLCQFTDWPAAEQAREATLAQLEAHLDAFMRANRNLELINGA